MKNWNGLQIITNQTPEIINKLVLHIFALSGVENGLSSYVPRGYEKLLCVMHHITNSSTSSSNYWTNNDDKSYYVITSFDGLLSILLTK